MSASESFKNFKKSFLRRLRTSAIEVAIFASLGVSSALMMAHQHENERKKTIPLAFSEIGQLIRDTQKKEDTLSLVNEYLPKTNDLCMKIFEAYDESNSLGGLSHTRFANELDHHMNLNNIYRYNLRDLIKEVPVLSGKILEEKKQFVVARDFSKVLEGVSSGIWSEYHHDNYHTETTTYTDSDGEEHEESVQVYDDTDHSYTYHRNKGELSSELGFEFLEKFPDLTIEDLSLASKTNADGEYAAEKTRKNKKSFDEKDYLNFSRKWYAGSTLVLSAREIEDDYAALQKDVPDWERNKSTARSTSYTTTSSTDSGPKEYRSANRLHGSAYSMKQDLNEFVLSLEKTRDEVAQLEGMIDKYIHDAYGFSEFSSNFQKKRVLANERKEILGTAKDIYRSTFKDGVDLHDYRVWYVALLGLAGLLGGAAIGVGVDYLGDHTTMYDHLE
ncbi:MAG: hypothetical protein KC535_05635 [Nanoarchaeota archaeon]|nr:hypothetical protein [Nanoarchaeota archaeon]